VGLYDFFLIAGSNHVTGLYALMGSGRTIVGEPAVHVNKSSPQFSYKSVKYHGIPTPQAWRQEVFRQAYGSGTSRTDSLEIICTIK
jgi:hypothetical protein